MNQVLDVIGVVRDFLAEAQTPGSATQQLAERLRAYVDGGGAVSLEEVLYLKPSRGRAPWWRVEKAQRVKLAARALLGAFDDIASVTTRAEAARRQAQRYASGRGKFAAADVGYSDPVRQAAHAYLRAAGEIPESRKTLLRAAGAWDSK